MKPTAARCGLPQDGSSTLSRLLPGLLLVAIAALSLWSWYSQGLVFDLVRQDWDAAAKIARLRTFFDDCGLWAPVVYVAFVTVEVVVAPIPGLMLYARGAWFSDPCSVVCSPWPAT